MGQNSDDYTSFQPMTSWANTYAQDCSFLFIFQLFTIYNLHIPSLDGKTLMRSLVLKSLVFPIGTYVYQQSTTQACYLYESQFNPVLTEGLKNWGCTHYRREKVLCNFVSAKYLRGTIALVPCAPSSASPVINVACDAILIRLLDR